MAVNFVHFPSEGLPFFSKRIQIYDVFCLSKGLLSVVVHYGYQVRKIVMCRKHYRLPQRAFVAFRITDQHEQAIRSSSQPRRKSRPCANAQAVAERAGRKINAGKMMFGMNPEQVTSAEIG